MTDFGNGFGSGFGLGIALGLGIAAVWMIVKPDRYVDCLDRATFRWVWLLFALRSGFMRLIGRAPSPAEGDAVALMRARVDSAIARRHSPLVDSDARSWVRSCSVARSSRSSGRAR